MNRERHTIHRLSSLEARKRRPAFAAAQDMSGGKMKDLIGRPPGVQRAEGRIVRSKGAMLQRSGSYARTPAKDNDLLYPGDTVNTPGAGEAVLKRRGAPRFRIGSGSMTKVTK